MNYKEVCIMSMMDETMSFKVEKDKSIKAREILKRSI